MTYSPYSEEKTVRLLWRRLDESALAQQASLLAQVLRRGDALCLHGELGAGKTRFAREIIATLSGVEDVASPTFTLVQSYPVSDETDAGLVLHHYDLYRLEAEEELEELGLDASLETGIALIEWPEIATSWVPQSALHITFAFTDTDRYRDIALYGDETWKTRLEQWTTHTDP